MIKAEEKKMILKTVWGGILDLVGTFPKINLSKGKTIDDLIHKARGAQCGKNPHFKRLES